MCKILHTTRFFGSRHFGLVCKILHTKPCGGTGEYKELSPLILLEELPAPPLHVGSSRVRGGGQDPPPL